MALKQVVNNNVRELTSPLAQREEQIRLMLEKALHPALILKLRNDLHLGRLLGKQPHGLRQKIDRLAHHQTDRDRVLPGAAVILPLLDRALELCPQIGKKAYKLAARRGQRRALSAALKDRKANLLLKQADLIGKRRLNRFSAARLKFKVRASSMQKSICFVVITASMVFNF